jgi:GNAT superfamily N-acetyltransferase
MKERQEVLIRPVRREDTPDALEITRHIWDGDDYVPQVWQEWLQDPRGCLLVAEIQGRVVGFVKLSESTPEDWWLQGLRVHPDFEGQGIASRLHDALLGYWLENGRGALRLSTHFERYQVHHLCERTGFRKIGEYTYFQAPALNDAAPDFRALTPDLADDALVYAQNSPLKELVGVYMDLGWEWMPPRLAKVTAAVQRNQAFWWQSRQGLLLFNQETEEDEQGPIPYIELVACQPEELVDLLLDYRRLAGERGYARAGMSLPLGPKLLQKLTAAGFERAWDGSVYLFEKSAQENN